MSASSDHNLTISNVAPHPNRIEQLPDVHGPRLAVMPSFGAMLRTKARQCVVFEVEAKRVTICFGEILVETPPTQRAGPNGLGGRARPDAAEVVAMANLLRSAPLADIGIGGRSVRWPGLQVAR